MRKDGRAFDALRSVDFQLDFTSHPLGSVLFRQGATMVLCTVCEQKGVPRWLQRSGQGWLTAEYSLLPGSTDRRSEREVQRGHPSGRTQEIQRLIGRSLRAVTDLRALGERTLHVDCDVLQADGGTRTASISGAYVALAVACRRLVARERLARDPLNDCVAAVSVGIVDGTLVLDLPYEEDSRAEVDMNVVVTGAGELVEIQGTGEGGTFSIAQLGELTDLALAGAKRIQRLQRQALEAFDG